MAHRADHSNAESYTNILNSLTFLTGKGTDRVEWYRMFAQSTVNFQVRI